jgi:ATP-dependent Clp protease protease subunit
MKYLLLASVLVGALLAAASLPALPTITLEESNTVVLADSINPDSVRDAQLELMSKRGSWPIYLFLDSPGGSVPAGLTLIETAKGLGREVKTISNFSASMSFIISQNLGERLILDSGVMMSHRLYANGMQGNVPGNLITRLNDLLRLTLKQDNLVAKRSKLNLQQYQTMIADELWMDSYTALSYGMADRRVSVKCGKSLDGEVTKNISLMMFELKVTFSKCPLIRTPLRIESPDQNSMNYQQRLRFEEVKNIIRARYTDKYLYYNNFIKNQPPTLE